MSELKKEPGKEEKITNKDYEDLIDQYQFSSQELKPGSLVKGKIIRVTSTHVLVDVGFKSEGIIPIEDFGESEDREKLEPGDEVEAILERRDHKEGYLVLSKKRATAIKAINNLEKAYKTNSWIIGKITNKIRNGYLVNVGIQAFMPESHADLKIIRDPKQLIGNLFKFKVLRFDRKSENAVLSRKLYLQDEKEKKKRRVFEQISKGMKVKGKVKSLTNFGAFVDIGGVEGLLHISDMSWGKINHPSEMFTTGMEIEIIILDFNEEDDKISLGYKQTMPNPWDDIEQRYQVNQKIPGKVVSLTDFGAFVEIEKGVEGLVHVSDLTWSRKTLHPKKVLSVGEEVTVSILSINAESQRISLGLKQTEPHPLEVLKETYSPGSRVMGKITSITDFGAFLEVEKGVEGLIHISDISWRKIKHPSDVLNVGQEVEAVILHIDVEKQKLSLGIKQLEGDIWEDFFNRHKIGDHVNVKVIRIADFGVFAEITPGIEGVVFLSELDDKKVENPEDVVSIGDERLAKIIKMSQRDKKLSLSFRQAQFDVQKAEYQKYSKSQDGSMTLGDLMGDQLRNLNLTPTKKKEKKAEEPKEKTGKTEKKMAAKEEKKEPEKKAEAAEEKAEKEDKKVEAEEKIGEKEAKAEAEVKAPEEKAKKAETKKVKAAEKKEDVPKEEKKDTKKKKAAADEDEKAAPEKKKAAKKSEVKPKKEEKKEEAAKPKKTVKSKEEKKDKEEEKKKTVKKTAAKAVKTDEGKGEKKAKTESAKADKKEAKDD